MKKLMKKKATAFTLVEMLIVLLVISILLLLFVPNLSKQKEAVKQTGNGAVVKVVEGQAELYELQHDGEASLATLVAEGMISQEQSDVYNEYYANNTDKTRTVNP